MVERRPGGSTQRIASAQRSLRPANNARAAGMPKITDSPETFAVTVDGVHATVPPLKSISLNQKYFFS